MILRFLWIKEFKNIKEQNFIFHDEKFIRFEDNNLNITSNSDYIENFFGDNLVSVTGIIGANGSGKSNLLDFIKLRLGSFGSGGWSVFDDGFECIVIFDKTIFCHKNIRIDNIRELQNQDFIIVHFNESLNEVFDVDLNQTVSFASAEDEILGNKYVFYSNVFDQRLGYDRMNIIDISTNTLVHFQNQETGRYDRESSIDSLTVFKIEEIKKQLDFVVDNTLSLPFELPKSIGILIESNSNRHVNPDYGFYKNNNVEELNFAFTFFGDYFDLKSEDAKEHRRIFKSIFLYRLLTVIVFFDPQKFSHLRRDDFRSFFIEYDFRIFEKLGGDILIDDIAGLISSLDELLKIGEIRVNRDKSFIYEIYNVCSVELNAESKETVFSFLKKYNSLVKERVFLEYYWSGLSSGQLNMLVLFSRFFYIRKHYSFEFGKHYVVMIDEGETYFHPSWQQTFLSNVINYLKQILSEMTFQIIVTSNSPFIASDLPKSKINFLDVDSNGNTLVVEDVHQQNETFASNIHTLYSDAFFMPNSLIGAFAKMKIEKVIGIINKEVPFDAEIPDAVTVQKYINLVGEPILQSLLQKQFNSMKHDNN